MKVLFSLQCLVLSCLWFKSGSGLDENNKPTIRHNVNVELRPLKSNNKDQDLATVKDFPSLEKTEMMLGPDLLHPDGPIASDLSTDNPPPTADPTSDQSSSQPPSTNPPNGPKSPDFTTDGDHLGMPGGPPFPDRRPLGPIFMPPRPDPYQFPPQQQQYQQQPPRAFPGYPGHPPDRRMAQAVFASFVELIYHQDGQINPKMTKVFVDSIREMFESEESMKRVTDFLVPLMYDDEGVMPMIRHVLSKEKGFLVFAESKEDLLAYLHKFISAIYRNNAHVVDKLRRFFTGSDFFQAMHRQFPTKEGMLEFGGKLMGDMYGQGLRRGVEIAALRLLPRIEEARMAALQQQQAMHAGAAAGKAMTDSPKKDM